MGKQRQTKAIVLCIINSASDFDGQKNKNRSFKTFFNQTFGIAKSKI